MRVRPRSARARTEGNTLLPEPPWKGAGLARARSARQAPYLLPRESVSFRAAPLSAVALLELLAAATPARLVAADVLSLRLDDRARCAGGRRRATAAHRQRGGRAGRAAARGGDRL